MRANVHRLFQNSEVFSEQWVKSTGSQHLIQLSNMTRPDRRGRPLKAFLQADIVGADVTIEQGSAVLVPDWAHLGHT
jgi:hypothetical protein